MKRIHLNIFHSIICAGIICAFSTSCSESNNSNQSDSAQDKSALDQMADMLLGPGEPNQVPLPPDGGDIKEKEENSIKIIITPENHVFIEVFGAEGSEWNDAETRKNLLDNVSIVYNSYSREKIQFTDRQKEAFANQSTFGVPLNVMGEFLDLYYKPDGKDQMDRWLAGEIDGKNTGIPVSWEGDADNPDEFQLWILAMQQTANPLLKETIDKGEIFLSADQNTDFDSVRMVMDNLNKIGQPKFILLTSLRSEE